MAAPSKSKYRNYNGGVTVTNINYPERKTVSSSGGLHATKKIIHGISHDSDGFTPTELYREKSKRYACSYLRQTRGQYIDYQANKYRYYYNTSSSNAYSAGVVYDRTRLPGYSPNYDNNGSRSIAGMDNSIVHILDRRILAKLGKASLDIGVILVDMKDTVNWISHRSTQLGKGLLAAKQGNLPAMGRILGFNPRKLKNWNVLRNRGRNPAADSLSSLILETNFAIRPILKDIEDGVALFHDPKHRVFNGVVKTAFDRVVTENWSWAYRNRDYNERLTDLHRKQVNFRINNPDLIARKALGLTTNPATAWEGVPWSWLVDYVVGVGDFLAETVATQGLVFLHGTVSRKATIQTTVTNNTTNTKTGAYDLISCKYSSECYKRDVVQTFPSPSLDFTFDDLTLTKALNVAAIMQKLRR